MTSFDTNVLLYAYDTSASEHAAARDVLESYTGSTEVVVCELTLIDLYVLLRNQAVVRRPLEPAAACAACQRYRSHPRWRLVESAPVMQDVWKMAGGAGFARRRVFDARLALTLRHHGVTRFVTRNEKDFRDFGFERVWNPFDAG